MSTKAAAVYGFLSGFGIPAYAAASVPDDATEPYLTYALPVGAWGDAEMAMEVNLWYYGDGEKAPNAKVQEISDAIGLGGVLLPCDGGAVWVKRGSPFAQSVTDGTTDDKIKRRYINIDLEYITTS